jgi:hypothetical protein
VSPQPVVWYCIAVIATPKLASVGHKRPVSIRLRNNTQGANLSFRQVQHQPESHSIQTLPAHGVQQVCYNGP